jgi:hypothetical protein
MFLELQGGVPRVRLACKFHGREDVLEDFIHERGFVREKKVDSMGAPFGIGNLVLFGPRAGQRDASLCRPPSDELQEFLHQTFACCPDLLRPFTHIRLRGLSAQFALPGFLRIGQLVELLEIVAFEKSACAHEGAGLWGTGWQRVFLQMAFGPCADYRNMAERGQRRAGQLSILRSGGTSFFWRQELTIECVCTKYEFPGHELPSGLDVECKLPLPVHTKLPLQEFSKSLWHTNRSISLH